MMERWRKPTRGEREGRSAGRRLVGWVATLVSLAVWCSPVVGDVEAKPEEETSGIPEIMVVVTGERIEVPVSESIASATVITEEEIEETGAATVAQALRAVPGVAVRESGQLGAVAQVSLRGGRPAQMLVLVDGRRASTPAFLGGTDLSKFPLAEVERIEVIRGPASSLYGSEAMGGVINIITKRPTEHGARVGIGFGSNGRAERGLSLFGAGSAPWQLTASFPHFGGERANSEYSATDLSGKVTLPVWKGWEMSVRGNIYRDTLGLPGADTAGTGYADPDDHMWWMRSSLDLVARRERASDEFEFRAYRVRQELHNVAPGLDWLSFEPTVFDTLVTGTTEAGEAVYRRSLGAHELVVGGEYRSERYQDVEAQDSVVLGEQDRGIVNRAVYVQDRWSVSEGTDVVLGARYDDHSRAGGKLAPRVGVSHVVGDGLRARASYGEGFRVPNLVELYYNAFGYVGNPDLKPEQSRQWEVGLNALRGRDEFDVVVFWNKVSDQIAWLGTTYENLEEARQRGVEVSWEHRFRGGARLALSYTNLNAKDLATGQRLLRVAREQISATLARRTREWGVALTGRWQGERPDVLGYDPDTWEPVVGDLPAYTVLDLRVEHSVGDRARPYLMIRNMLDKSYQPIAGYPAEGRTAEVGLTVDW